MSLHYQTPMGTGRAIKDQRSAIYPLNFKSYSIIQVVSLVLSNLNIILDCKGYFIQLPQAQWTTGLYRYFFSDP